MVNVKSPVYYYKRKDIYYFCRGVPSDLRHRFNKNKIEVSLKTKSQMKAARSAAARGVRSAQLPPERRTQRMRPQLRSSAWSWSLPPSVVPVSAAIVRRGATLSSVTAVLLALW